MTDDAECIRGHIGRIVIRENGQRQCLACRDQYRYRGRVAPGKSTIRPLTEETLGNVKTEQR